MALDPAWQVSGLIEEWHRMVRQIEQPCLYTDAFTQVLKNPTRRHFRKAALARAANNDGDYGHTFDTSLLAVVLPVKPRMVIIYD